MATRPPPPIHILETCLYVKSMTASNEFYQSILGLEPSLSVPRLSVYPLGPTTLILFQQGATAEDSLSNNGKNVIPGHGPSHNILQQLAEQDGHLKQHYCLAVESRDEVDRWEAFFKEKGVLITGQMEWELGGRSVYFADPDGHVGEIVSRGVWSHY